MTIINSTQNIKAISLMFRLFLACKHRRISGCRFSLPKNKRRLDYFWKNIFVVAFSSILVAPPSSREIGSSKRLSSSKNLSRNGVNKAHCLMIVYFI